MLNCCRGSLKLLLAWKRRPLTHICTCDLGWISDALLLLLQIATPGTKRFTQNDAARSTSEKMHALGRIGEPADVARAMSFLLHPDNNFITGQILGIDGGLANVAPLTVSK